MDVRREPARVRLALGLLAVVLAFRLACDERLVTTANPATR